MTVEHPNFDEVGSAYTPDYISSEYDEKKASAWAVFDDPHEHDEGIYVSYSPDGFSEYRRGFTLNAQQAIDLIDDIEKALDRLFGPCECESAQEING